MGKGNRGPGPAAVLLQLFEGIEHCLDRWLSVQKGNELSGASVSVCISGLAECHSLHSPAQFLAGCPVIVQRWHIQIRSEFHGADLRIVACGQQSGSRFWPPPEILAVLRCHQQILIGNPQIRRFNGKVRAADCSCDRPFIHICMILPQARETHFLAYPSHGI